MTRQSRVWPAMPTSPDDPHPRTTVDADGVAMSCVDRGEGDAIVFLHGNPTSSYLWRNVIPHVADLGRCVAPDLVGMGRSAKLPDSGPGVYGFARHAHHLDACLDALAIGDHVTLVVHDWGSGLGFDWARRHPEAVAGICYLEAICGPLSFADWPQVAQKAFARMRSEVGEQLVLQENFFVDRILPSSVLRELTEAEMAAYRAPYEEPGESRRPTLEWPRQIPFDGQPAEVDAVVSGYAEWLAASEVPKLYLHAEPGFLSGVFAERCRAWPNQTEVRIRGHHFVQEDSPDEVGQALRAWLLERR